MSCLHPGQIKGLAYILQISLSGNVTPGDFGPRPWPPGTRASVLSTSPLLFVLCERGGSAIRTRGPLETM